MPLAPGVEKPTQGRVHHLDDWLPLQCGGTVFLPSASRGLFGGDEEDVGWGREETTWAGG